HSAARVDHKTREAGYPGPEVRPRRAAIARGNEPSPKVAPLAPALLDQRERHAKHASLPWCVEDELAVLARERGFACHAPHLGTHVSAHYRATPIIASRVTAPASSSSLAPSVPGGRAGTTR